MRLAPHLIPPTQGVIYQNIDSSKGHFAPLRAKKDVSTTNPVGPFGDFGFYFDLAGEAYFTEEPNDWVVYKEVLYWADRVNRPQRRTGKDTFVQLGITAPVTTSVTLTGQGTAVDPAIPITYVITYYNANTGAESAPSLVGTINKHTTSQTLGTLPASLDPQVTHIRIYRLGDNITEYSLVAAVANTAGTFVDDIADDMIDGTILTTNGYMPAPIGAKYLTEFNAMLFAADGDQLRFTPIGVPYAWPLEYYLDIPGTITGIGKTPIGLLVFTLTKTILVTGTGPSSLAQQLIADDKGCITHDSITNIKGQTVWVSLQGIAASSGGPPEIITKEFIGFDTADETTHELFATAVNALEFNEAYYIHFEEAGKMAVMDFAYQPPVFKYLSVGDTKSLIKVNNRLFALGAAKLWELFEDTTYLTAHFKSGWLSEGALLEPKVQDRLRIAYTGNVTVRLYVNGAIAFTKAYSTTKTIAVEEGKLPYDKTRNYFIEIELEGNGQVFELVIEQNSANG